MNGLIMANKVMHGFWEATVFSWTGAQPVPAECWFAATLSEVDPRDCDGEIQGCHFIKRQRVREIVGYNLWIPTASRARDGKKVFVAGSDNAEQLGLLELLTLAEWDPRNAVPGCKHHHDRFDSHLMPPLVVHREDVPCHVIEFAEDWGLETALEDRCPPKGSQPDEAPGPGAVSGAFSS